MRPLLPHGNVGSPAPAGTPCPATVGEVRGGAGVCLHRVKERHHRGRPNSSSESSAKHSRHASERRKSPSPSPGQRSSSWSSSGSLSKSRSRSREKRVGRSRSRSPSPKKPASRSAPGGLRHGGTGTRNGLREHPWLRVVPVAPGLGKGLTGRCWPWWHWKCQPQVGGVTPMGGCCAGAVPASHPGPQPTPLTLLLLLLTV